MTRILLVVLAVSLLVVAQDKPSTKTAPPHEAGHKASLKAKATNHSVTLSWTQGTITGSGSITGNGIWRVTGSSCTGALKIADTSPNPVVTYVDSGLPASTTYSYYVTAKCASCQTQESGPSNCVTATTQADPGTVNPPTGLTVTGQQ